MEEKNGSITTASRQADAGYKGFPSFEDWSKCLIDLDRWERYTSALRQRASVPQELLQRALEEIKRAAAIDTGAIEGFYEVDRGFTLTVATEAAMWEAAVAEKGQKFQLMFESQLKAYDYVLDFATRQVPIAESWIRELHSVICRSQNTYDVHTAVGAQAQVLPLGEYKHSPNHVISINGEVHSYSPVDLTNAEMQRFCEQLRSDAFVSAHPILQASYAHYAFILIHPFADGNGRVARALASVFTYRSHSIPLLILVDNRKEYLLSLKAADHGDYQRFVNFIFERTLDAIQMLEESLRTASAPTMQSALSDLKRLHITRGGYSHVEVDTAGNTLMEWFHKEFNDQKDAIKDVNVLNINTQMNHPGTYTLAKRTSRLPIGGGRTLKVVFHSAAPATASLSLNFNLEVPKDCDLEDTLVVYNPELDGLFEARMTELVPVPTPALLMRVSMRVRGIIGKAITELTVQAAQSLRS